MGARVGGMAEGFRGAAPERWGRGPAMEGPSRETWSRKGKMPQAWRGHAVRLRSEGQGCVRG